MVVNNNDSTKKMLIGIEGLSKGIEIIVKSTFELGNNEKREV